MEKVMLSLHVLSAIVTVGPVTVAAWLFVLLTRERVATTVALPGAGRIPSTSMSVGAEAARPLRVGGVSLGFLHRVNVVGSIVALAVPVFGFATAVQLGVLTDTWLIIAIALTALAAVVFIWGVLAGQRRTLTDTPSLRVSRLLLRTTLGFTLLWMVVVTLMIFRPGSTTGVA